jgi:hypothetical protein
MFINHTRGTAMSNKLLIVGAWTALLVFGANAQALNEKETAIDDAKADSRVQVEWVNPKKFTDMRERNFSSERFRKHVFAKLEEHLSELAEALPEGQSLKLTVTDVDLAGRVEPGTFSGLIATHENIRIMRDIDIPRMKFAYSLVDAQGKVLKQEEVNLKDMNYLQRMRSNSSNRPFVYEKRMLTRWFNDSFETIDEQAS